MANATISDVARAAGVSTMTVSRVINGESNVRESTRAAVGAAIKQLGYRPNKAARSLASGRQIQLGLLYDNPSSGYLSAMLLGLLEQARQSDTQVVVAECASVQAGRNELRQMIRSGVSGVILSPPLADAPEILETVTRSDCLGVTIGTRHIDSGVASVRIDEYQAARTMTEHILALGHRRVGFIIGSPDQASSDTRLQGFRDAMSSVASEATEDLVVQGHYSYRSGLAAAEALLGLPDPPTAIFASNDDMAAAAIATAHRRNIEVPGQLTVCGFDDTRIATMIWPEITTVHQPIADMAQAAVDILVRVLRASASGGVMDPQHLTLDFRIIVRQSDGPPR